MEEEKVEWLPCGKGEGSVLDEIDFAGIEQSILRNSGLTADQLGMKPMDNSSGVFAAINPPPESPPETFTLADRKWNITAVWKWLGDRPANTEVDVKSAARLMAVGTINRAHAATVDLTRPLLTVFVEKFGGVFVVDGWHRLYRATLDGVDTLPAHQLTMDELDRFEIK